MHPLTIKPWLGIEPYRFGMRKDELWALSRSPVVSYYAQAWDTVRCDEFTLDHVTVHYDAQTQGANFISVGFPAHLKKTRPVLWCDENIGDYSLADLQALLDLTQTAYAVEDQCLVVKTLGVIFGFREVDGLLDQAPLDYLNIQSASC